MIQKHHAIERVYVSVSSIFDSDIHHLDGRPHLSD